MIVAVGSENKAKLKAVERAFARYFKGVNVRGIAVKSSVGKQPIGLEAIVKGAKERAAGALAAGKADFGVGIEAGVFPFPGCDSGYMDTACCAIFDGARYCLGGSPLYEYPEKVVKKLLAGKEVSEVFMEIYGLSKDFVQGEESVSGFLTKGAMPRTELLEHAVVCALAQVINKEVYNK